MASRGAKQVAVTSLAFPSNDVNKFIVGSEECVAYQVCNSNVTLSVTLTDLPLSRVSVMGVNLASLCSLMGTKAR